MKTTTVCSSILALALSSVVWGVCCAGMIHAQTTLNLDLQPAFDFGDDPTADPLFAPGTLGLTNGAAGFDQASAMSAFAATAGAVFPPSHEVFLAYCGNPRYALLTNPATAAASLTATNPLGLVRAFKSAGQSSGIIVGRTWGGAGEPLDLLLHGNEYEVMGLDWVSPLVLDLDGDGVLSASRGLWRPHPARLTGPYAAFDMDGDGFQDITEWVGAGDGLLCTSPNPQSGRDLLGTAGGWRDGFEHLAAQFDANTNGLIEGAELNGLYVWRDANTTAIADAGEVVSAPSLGITWIATTHHGYVSGYGYLNGLGGAGTNAVWDWWPNYALANRRAIGPAGAGHPLVGQDAMAAIRNILFGRVVDDNSPPRTAGLGEPRHIPPAQLAAWGIDLSSFRLALLADGGRAIIGYDASSATPGRARLLEIQQEIKLDYARIYRVVLPFEQVFQMACDPSGGRVLVLGDHGAKLAVVDFAAETVTPPDGLDLRSVGLRASGVAGYDGAFWFTAWQLDEQGAVIDELVWAITPWGFWGGLSLDALRTESGQLRSYFITGPTSGFFAVPGPTGTNEQLWSIVGTNRTFVDTAGSFGGMHALAKGKVKWFNEKSGDPDTPDASPPTVAYTKRDGGLYTFAVWQTGTNVTVLGTNSTPFFYPFLTDGGGTAIAATLDPGTQTMNMIQCRQIHALPPGPAEVTPLLTTYPGQGKVAWGAFAHYGTNGLDLVPVADPEPSPSPPQVWRYTLLPESQLLDDCICDRLTIPVPLRGSFDLRLLEENALFACYEVTNLSFVAGAGGATRYTVTGHGLYQKGELAQLQDLFLELRIDDGLTNRPCYFTNDGPAVERLWPMLKAHVDETNQPPTQFYRLDLVAAPFREIWFSTASKFTPGVQPPFTNRVSAGDLASSAGRVVLRNRDLTRRLGLQPSPDPLDLGLDAVDLLSGGEIAFSIGEDAFSQTLGPLHHGDVLSDRGRVVTNYASLINAFSPEPPAVDEGLDALQVLGSGEIIFSITNDFFSERLGRMIRRGDLLSSRGAVVKTQEELLARFHPAFPKAAAGLDALWVWPSGEVWFSTETNFYNEHFERFNRGDLLSDQGYVVYRNLVLLAPFQPLEDTGDFGLDALYVISDMTAPPGPAQCVSIRREPGPNDVTLEWAAQGHAFQLEKATNVTGPYQPLGPTTTDTLFTDPGALTNASQSFYRLRQW